MPSHDLVVSLALSDDASFTQKLFEALFSSRDTTTTALVSSVQRSIADGAEEALPFGDIALAKLVFVKSSRQVKLKITSAAGSEQIVFCGAAAASAGVFASLTNATAIAVLNNSGATATVTACLGGSA